MTVCRGTVWVGEGGGVALAVSPPEAGPSWAPPQKPEQTVKGANRGPGIIIPEKNCTWCVTWESLCQWDPEGYAQSCQLCQRFEELTEKGKRRAEDKGEGAGPSKRPRVEPSSERMERRRMEVRDPQVGSRVVEALWALNTRLGEMPCQRAHSCCVSPSSTTCIRSR